MATPRIDRLDKNFLINGGLDYWQRNNNLSTGAGEISGYNSVDRFAVTTFNTSGTRQSAQQVGDKPNELTKYSGLLAFTSTASATFDISQKIEGIFARELSGKTCSFGMWYKTDEFSSIRVRILRPTAEDNYASTVTIYDQTIAVTADSTWRQLKIEGGIVMDSSMYLGCQVIISGGARVNSSGSRFFRWAQPQLSIGATLPSFNRFARDVTSEELACSRYYQKSYAHSVAPGTASDTADYRHRAGTSSAIIMVPFKVNMRVAPTMTWYNPVTGGTGSARNYSAGDNPTATTEISATHDHSGVFISGGGLTAGHTVGIHFTADAEI